MRFRANNPYVISETIQSETIIIHLTTGTYYSLQGSGAEVWESISGAASAAEIGEELAARYGIPAGDGEAAAAALIAELQREELIVETTETARDAAPAAAPAAGGFVAPTLSKYTDMQDLVLLDPVHEVGDAGWPAKPEVAGA